MLCIQCNKKDEFWRGVFYVESFFGGVLVAISQVRIYSGMTIVAPPHTQYRIFFGLFPFNY